MKIVVVGSGNVAVQLGLAFKAAGHDILCVIGRSKIAAQRAGLTLETAYQNNFDKIQYFLNVFFLVIFYQKLLVV